MIVVMFTAVKALDLDLDLDPNPDFHICVRSVCRVFGTDFQDYKCRISPVCLEAPPEEL